MNYLIRLAGSTFLSLWRLHVAIVRNPGSPTEPACTALSFFWTPPGARWEVGEAWAELKGPARARRPQPRINVAQQSAGRPN